MNVNDFKKELSNVAVLDCKNSHFVLKTVLELYNEICTDTKKWDENSLKIEQILTKFLAFYPNDTRALINLGAILSNTGQHEDALIRLLQAEQLESKDANLFRNIAIAKINIESERQNAEIYFEKANKFKSDKFTIEAYFDYHAH